MKNQLYRTIAGILILLPLVIIDSPSALSQNERREKMVVFHNYSRRTVNQIRVWRPDRQEWSRNRLEKPLLSREDIAIRISGRDDSRSDCNYRIWVEQENGRTIDSTVDACNNSHVSLRRGSIYASPTTPLD